MAPTSPQTRLHHTWLDPTLRAHYAKTPMPEGAGRLLDLPPDEFLETEQEIHVVAACLWTMSVRYDGLGRGERPKNREELRRWIVKYRNEAISKIANKIEPPFTAYSIDQIQKDVGGMMEELLLKTLPTEEEQKAEEAKKAEMDKAEKAKAAEKAKTAKA